jgi:hypothetical protein
MGRLFCEVNITRGKVEQFIVLNNSSEDIFFYAVRYISKDKEVRVNRVCTWRGRDRGCFGDLSTRVRPAK